MSMSPYVLAMRAKIGHELLMLQSAAALLFDEAGRLLLVQSAESGRWLTIGGAVEPQESPADAAVRECWEETGLLVEPVALMGVYGGPDFTITYANGDVVSYVAAAFEVKLIGGTPRPDGEEICAMRYVSRDEAATLPMSAAVRQVLSHAFEWSGTPYFARATWRPPSRG